MFHWTNLPTFANPPTESFYSGVVVASLIAVGLIVSLLRRGMQGRKSSRFLLVMLAFVTATLIASAIAVLTILLGDVPPLDRLPMFAAIMVIGLMAGSLAGGLLALFAGPANDETPPNESV